MAACSSPARIRRTKRSSFTLETDLTGITRIAPRSTDRFVARQERTRPGGERQLLPDRFHRCRRAEGRQGRRRQAEEPAVDVRPEGPRRRGRDRRRSEQHRLGHRSAVRLRPRGIVRVREARRRKGDDGSDDHAHASTTTSATAWAGRGCRLPTAKEPLELLEDRRAREAVQKALDTPAEKRTAEQKALLLTRYKQLDPGWQKLEQADQGSPGEGAEAEHRQGADLVRRRAAGPTAHAGRGRFQGHALPPSRRSEPEGSGRVAELFAGSVHRSTNRWKKSPPKDSKLSYRRTAFADWITDVDNGGGAVTGPRDRQSPLAASHGPRHRRHAERFRHSRRTADASGVARLTWPTN